MAQLAEITGKHKTTIGRVLHKMESIQDPVTSELIPMVKEKKQNGANPWYALDVDLDHIAKILGVEGNGRRQQLQHKKEQKLFEQRLKRAQLKIVRQ